MATATPFSGNWPRIITATTRVVGASSLLWIGDVLASDMPPRPMTCAAFVCQEQDGLRTRMFVTLDNLAPSHAIVIRPIPVIVQEDDGAYVASFQDANINASGETVPEALCMLRDMIASSLRLLNRKESTLANETHRQLTVLRKFVREQ